MEALLEKTTHGLKWSAIERILTQGLQLAFTLVLAKLLGPAAFGMVGMLAIFIAISNVIVDSGFTSALVRKQDRSQDDLATAFYYNASVSVVCYSILFIVAPTVSRFYGEADLQYLLRVLAFVVLINAFNLIPRTLLVASMNFKLLAIASMSSALISGIAAIAMAMLGYGVWALVIQSLLNAIITTLIFNIMSPWRPQGRCTLHAFKYLFGFGNKLLLSGLLDTLYNQLYFIIIGKKFTPNILGEFSQAHLLAGVPASTMTNIIQRVTYPMFSQWQSDTQRMTQAYAVTLKLAAVVIFPLIMGLAIIAQPLLTVCLGLSWQNAGTLLSVLCIGYMLYPIHAINLNLLQVMGRSDLFLKLELVKKIIGVLFLIVTTPLGILSMCIGLGLFSYLSLFLNTYYTAKLIHITQWQQFKNIFPIWLAVMISAYSAYSISLYWFMTPWLQICMSLLLALLFYFTYLFFGQRVLLRNVGGYLFRRNSI